MRGAIYTARRGQLTARAAGLVAGRDSYVLLNWNALLLPRLHHLYDTLRVTLVRFEHRIWSYHDLSYHADNDWACGRRAFHGGGAARSTHGRRRGRPGTCRGRIDFGRLLDAAKGIRQLDHPGVPEDLCGKEGDLTDVVR